MDGMICNGGRDGDGVWIPEVVQELEMTRTDGTRVLVVVISEEQVDREEVIHVVVDGEIRDISADLLADPEKFRRIGGEDGMVFESITP